MNLKDTISTLDAISDIFREIDQNVPDRVKTSTYTNFINFLEKECGVDENLQVIDNELWVKFKLSKILT